MEKREAITDFCFCLLAKSVEKESVRCKKNQVVSLPTHAHPPNPNTGHGKAAKVTAASLLVEENQNQPT